MHIFYQDVRPKVLNRNFIHIMIQHKLVCQFIQRYVNIQEIFEIIRMDYDKKICINIMIINIVYNINYNIDDLN